MGNNGNQTANDWIDPEDAPDLSTSEWAAKISAAPLNTGQSAQTRPVVDNDRLTDTSTQDDRHDT